MGELTIHVIKSQIHLVRQSFNNGSGVLLVQVSLPVSQSMDSVCPEN
jgi:hypothetical protein